MQRLLNISAALAVLSLYRLRPSPTPLVGQGYVAVPSGENHYRIKTRKARRNLLEHPRRAAMPRFALGEIHMADQLG